MKHNQTLVRIMLILLLPALVVFGQDGETGTVEDALPPNKEASAQFGGEPVEPDYAQFEQEGTLETVLQNGHNDSILAMDMHPKGKYILTGSTAILLWDFDGKIVKSFSDHQGAVLSVSFSPNGVYYASAGEDRDIVVRRIDGAFLHRIPGGEGYLNCADWSKDGNRLVGGMQAKYARIWDAHTGDLYHEILIDENASIWAIECFQKDGRDYVLLGGMRGPETLLVVYDMETGEYAWKYDVTDAGMVNKVSVSEKKGIILAATSEGRTIVGDFNGNIVQTLPSSEDASLTCVSVSENGTYIVAGKSFDDMSGGIDLYDARSGERIASRTIPVPETGSPGWKTGEVVNVAFAPNDEYIIVGQRDGRLRFLRPDETLEEVKLFQGYFPRLSELVMDKDASHALLSADSRTLSPTLVIWDFNGTRARMIRSADEGIVGMGFCNNDREVYSVREDGSVRHYSLAGKLLKSFSMGEGYYHTQSGGLSVTYLPDGTLVGVKNATNVFRYNPDTEESATFSPFGDGGGITRMKVAPTGKHIVVVMDKTVAVWTTDGAFVTNIDLTYGISDISFSKEGDTLATMGWGGYFHTWKIPTLEFIGTYETDGGTVSRVAFAQGGKTAVSAGEKSIAIWDMERGVVVETFPGHRDVISTIAISPDGQYFFTISWDGMFRVWNKTTKDYLSLLAFSTGDWFVLAKDGKFDCSDGGRDFVTFTKGLTTYGPDQFWPLSYTPKLLPTFLMPQAYKDAGKAVKVALGQAETFRLVLDNAKHAESGKAYLLAAYEQAMEKSKGKAIYSLRKADTAFRSLRLNDVGKEKQAVALSAITLAREALGDTIAESHKATAPSAVTSALSASAISVASVSETAENMPGVTIVEPETAFTTKSKQVRITVEAQPGANGIDLPFLFLNGRVINEGTPGVVVAQQGDRYYTFTFNLAAGKNSVKAAAFDKSHEVYGVSRPLYITYESEDEVLSDIYILAAGVSEYKDSRLSLTYPKDDTRAIGALLHTVAEGRFKNTYSTILIDNEANQTAIKGALADIAERAQIEDTVIIFLAGHGYTKDEKYYYLPYDASKYNLDGTCVASDDLKTFFRTLAAQNVALFFDTCHSGAAINTKVIADIGKESGIAIFSAVSDSKLAYERDELGHGLFTYSILEALTKRQSDVTMNVKGRQRVIVGKLLSVVYYLTVETADMYGIEQSPVKFTFGSEFDIGQIDVAE